VTGYQKRDAFWESVVARMEFSDDELVSSELHPITMGQNMSRSRRGTPRLTSVEEARRILTRLDGLSRPFGTSVEIVEKDGRCFGRMVAGK
jgi:poly-gamma-glutamate synthesis protein (capsule biosynthesis protein)